MGIIRKIAAKRPCRILNRKMIASIKKATVKNIKKLLTKMFKIKSENLSMSTLLDEFFKLF